MSWLVAEINIPTKESLATPYPQRDIDIAIGLTVFINSMTSVESHDLQTTDADGEQRKLTPRQLEVIDHISTHRKPVSELAKDLGMDRTNLYRMLRYQHVKDALRERLTADLTRGALLAGEELVSLLDHKSAYIRLEASKKLIDSQDSGGSQGNQTNIQVNVDLSGK